MSQTEAAMRRAGALVALAAASALARFPAAEVRKHVVLVLALHAVLLLGCAAVQLSPAHRAVADVARRTRTMALGASAAGLRWVGFAGIVLYALYVAGDVRTKAAAEASLDNKIRGFLLFLMFLAGVWAVYLSMVTGRDAPPPPAAVAAAEEDLDGGEVNGMVPRPARVVVDSKV